MLDQSEEISKLKISNKELSNSVRELMLYTNKNAKADLKVFETHEALLLFNDSLRDKDVNNNYVSKFLVKYYVIIYIYVLINIEIFNFILNLI